MRLARVLALAALAMVFAGCPRHGGTKTATSNANDQTAKEEAAIENDLKKEKFEARDWLQDSSHEVFKMGGRERFAKMADTYYEIGAKEVWMTRCSKHEQTTFAGAMVVVLPTSKDERKEFFEKANEKSPGEFEDKGEKYIILDLD